LLSDQFASRTGARTLDTLHVAAARLLGAKEFLTSDDRQAKLARAIGLKVLDPTSKYRNRPLAKLLPVAQKEPTEPDPALSFGIPSEDIPLMTNQDIDRAIYG